VQNVLLGVSEQCPGATTLLGTEGGASYVIDEGWSPQGSSPTIGGGGGNSLMADDPNGATGTLASMPTQNGLELASFYSASNISVLLLIVLVATLFGFLVRFF
jgi:hypothetical protein